jgi:hypothetical protein
MENNMVLVLVRAQLAVSHCGRWYHGENTEEEEITWPDSKPGHHTSKAN